LYDSYKQSPKDLEIYIFNQIYYLFEIITIEQKDMRVVGREMINRFLSGIGGEYSNPVLTKEAVNHPSTQRYMVGGGGNPGSKQTIIDFIKKHKGDINKVKLDAEFKRVMDNNVGRPRYNIIPADVNNGLMICINDTWGNYIEIKNYRFDEKTFSGTIRFTIYDHFGLDESDVISDKPAGNTQTRGFGDWFVLQHYKGCDGKYKPFITYIEHEIEFSGSF
jgi:hypothetical protein